MTMKRTIIMDLHPRRVKLIFREVDLQRLHSLATLHIWEEGRMPAEMLEKHLPQADAIIGQTDLPAERLRMASNLKAIVNVEGNFLPNVDYDACFRGGIYVLNAGVAFAQAVAEMVLGLALSAARGIPAADRLFRQGAEVYGHTSNRDSFLLAGKELGIIGFGNLGRALLRLLGPFGCTVRVFDPWLPDNHLRSCGVVPCSLEELLAAGATTENAAMIGARELARMPDGAVLIVASRASLVDFAALTEELRSGRIRAAVDTFPEEPLAADHPLRRLDNLVLSAHRAGSLKESYELMGEMTADDLTQIFNGLAPVRLQQARPETVKRMRSKPVG
jgi:phosphoglycerate dehydrogenase-like enzyme